MAVHWRQTREYRIWRATIIRNVPRCISCNSIKNRHAHHVEHATYNKGLRFTPSNGVTLCSGCHSDFHNKKIGNTRKNCNKDDLNDYLAIVRNSIVRSHQQRFIADPF